MQKNHFKISLTISILSISLLSNCVGNKKLPDNYWESSVPIVKQTQRNIPFGDLRDYPYCEILPVFKNGNKLITEVYNTISCNKCPNDKWFKITADDLKEELGAEDVKLNGPRHWVINKAKVGTNVKYDKIASFGDIQMQLAAQIDGKIQIKPYSDVIVKRWNTWIFKKENRVYILVNDKGEKYIMQSYSRQVDKNQSIDDLQNLGSTLNLPDGWSFETELLNQDLELVAEGEAYVIQDLLWNTYQKVLK